MFTFSQPKTLHHAKTEFVSIGSKWLRFMNRLDEPEKLAPIASLPAEQQREVAGAVGSGALVWRRTHARPDEAC